MSGPSIPRRRVLSGLCAATAAAIAPATLAAPPLSARNYGLLPGQASRSNAWLEIDAGQFERNIAAVSRHIDGSGAQLCAIVKADAYGHGLSLLMPSLVRAAPPYLGVASNDEARIARECGYRGRIMRVRAATLTEIEDGARWRIEELVGSLSAAQRIAAQRRRRPLEVHLALNCDGMSRNGLELKTDAGRDEARALLALPGLRFVGAMTHYPTDNLDDIRRQLERYGADLAWLTYNAQLPHVVRHTANSFTTMNVPAARLDLVRVGGAIFGDDFPQVPQIQPLMTLKSRVAAVSRFPAGETVSYDRTYALARESWLANVPVGYSDGYRRTFSHGNVPGASAAELATRTQVLIGGARYPVLGRVTMNTIMVDVTEARERVRVDDEVVLFGRQGAERITQEEAGANNATIGPDLYTVWGNSLPKVLVRT